MNGPTQASVDVIAHRGEGTLIGAFRCPPGHHLFKDSGPIQNDIFVFPRSSVRIRRAGGHDFVADPTVATVYNRGQEYERRPVSCDGDRSDWFAVSRALALEAVAANGLEPAASGPFSFSLVPVADRTYLAQRRLFRKAQLGLRGSEVDEGIYALLDDIVGAAAGSGQQPRKSGEEARQVAEEVRSLLSSRAGEEWPLARLAGHFGLSQFTLCRAFRRATGSTIHKYLLTVRLRASLERLERPEVDLSALAYDLGFSGHSHFSVTFRRAFGQTPSACRTVVSSSPPGRRPRA